jgi:hypothetical protein
VSRRVNCEGELVDLPLLLLSGLGCLLSELGFFAFRNGIDAVTGFGFVSAARSRASATVR